MADTSKTLEIVVSLKDNFSKGIGLARKRIDELKGSVFNLKTGLLGLGATLGAKKVSLSFVDAADKAEQLRLRLDNLLNSAEEGGKVFDNTAAYAKTVAFEFEHLMETATTLAGVTKGGAEEIAKWLPIISDLAAVAGLSLQETTSNFVRMYAAGAAAADLFRERGILGLLDFHAKTAYTVQETRDKVVKAWEDVNSRFKDTSKDLALTWKGLLSMMKDRWFFFRLDVMKHDVYANMKASVGLLIDELDRLSESGALEEWAERVADSIMKNAKRVVLGIAGVTDTITGLVKALVGIWDSFPKEFKQFGLVGALLYGRKGAAIGASFGAVLGKFKDVAREAAIEVMLLAGDLDEASVKLYRSGKKTEEAYNKLMGMKPDENAFIATEGVLGFLGLPKEEAATKAVESLFKGLDKKVQEMRDAQAAKDAKRTGEGLKSDKSLTLQTESKLALANLKATSQTALAELDRDYETGLESFKNYWDRRAEILTKQAEAELAHLKVLAAAATEPEKKATLEMDIVVGLEQQKQAEIALQQEKFAAEQELFNQKVELQNVLAALDMENNAAGLSRMQLKFEQENAALEEQQQREYQLMMDYTSKLDDEIKKRTMIEDLARKQKAQKDKLVEEQETKGRLGQLKTAGKVASGLGDIANSLYEAGGRQSKKMFNLAKAASVAQATIKMFESIVGALGSPPYSLGAIANAALVGAMGAANIASIQSQTMATGGEVLGHSPHSKADNIPISATAGEFMQPISAVKHYGMAAMEAIRRKLIPREVFMNMGGLIPKRAYGSAAEGGSIMGNLSKAESESASSKIEIINITNPDAIRALAMDAVYDNREVVVNMVLGGLEDRNIELQRAYT